MLSGNLGSLLYGDVSLMANTESTLKKSKHGLAKESVTQFEDSLKRQKSHGPALLGAALSSFFRHVNMFETKFMKYFYNSLLSFITSFPDDKFIETIVVCVCTRKCLFFQIGNIFFNIQCIYSIVFLLICISFVQKYKEINANSRDKFSGQRRRLHGQQPIFREKSPMPHEQMNGSPEMELQPEFDRHAEREGRQSRLYNEGRNSRLYDEKPR